MSALPIVCPIISVYGSNYLPSDILEDLELKLSQFSSLGKLILVGEMKSCTLDQPDFVFDDDWVLTQETTVTLAIKSMVPYSLNFAKEYP